MIRIRFHGRGGHGVKTASRILGSAAFGQEWFAQDSPIYGAERRGAAVVAFTRISEEPILERGLIDQPDLIILGDETLLDDPGAGVLAGQENAATLFVNAESSQLLAQKHAITAPVAAHDVTACTLLHLNCAAALSSGLAAAAARLAGVIDEERLHEAVRDELEHLGLPAETIEKNQRVASEIFQALHPISLLSPTPPTAVVNEVTMHEVAYESPLLGAPSVLAAGNAEQRHTGSWRIERPEIDYDICTRCGLCYVLCPDGAIELDDEGYPAIDYDNCKGCMICAHECPIRGILRQKEVRSW